MSFCRHLILKKSLLSLNFKSLTPLFLRNNHEWTHLFINNERKPHKSKTFIPAWHLTPIPSRELLNQLEAEGKLEALKVMPVKPAPNDMTDSVYSDPVFKHFTTLVMQWADKTLARQLMFDTFARIKRIQLDKYYAAPEEEKSSIILDPLVIMKRAIQNCQPVLALTPIKKGGITYQVPVPITPKRAQWMSMKWLIMAARDKEGEITFVEQMSKELLDAFNQEGRVYKRKLDLHKVCENNKAYAHYRWS